MKFPRRAALAAVLALAAASPVALGYSPNYVAGTPAIPGQGADTVSLGALTLSASSFVAGTAAPGSVVGNIIGTVPGASVSFVPNVTSDAGRLTVTGDLYAGGWQLVVGSTATTISQTIAGSLVQTLAGVTLSTPVTITATVGLQALALSTSYATTNGITYADLVANQAQDTQLATISGAAVGSTITADPVNTAYDTNRLYVFGSGSTRQIRVGSKPTYGSRYFAVKLTETLNGNTNQNDGVRADESRRSDAADPVRDRAQQRCDAMGELGHAVQLHHREHDPAHGPADRRHRHGAGGRLQGPEPA